MKQNKIYEAVALVLQKLESKDLLKTDSHSLSQKITSNVEYNLLTKRQKELFKVLLNSKDWSSTKKIHAKIDNQTHVKNTSAMLIELRGSSSLITSKFKGVNLYWKACSPDHFKETYLN